MDAGIGGDGSDSLSEQWRDAAKARTHADAGPDGPFEIQAPAIRVIVLEAINELSHSFVGDCVIGFAAHSDAGDDGAEGDEQADVLLADGGEDVDQAVLFGGKRA